MPQGETEGCVVCIHPAALLLHLASWVSTLPCGGRGDHASFDSTPSPFTLRVNAVSI